MASSSSSTGLSSVESALTLCKSTSSCTCTLQRCMRISSATLALGNTACRTTRRLPRSSRSTCATPPRKRKGWIMPLIVTSAHRGNARGCQRRRPQDGHVPHRAKRRHLGVAGQPRRPRPKWSALVVAAVDPSPHPDLSDVRGLGDDQSTEIEHDVVSKFLAAVRERCDGFEPPRKRLRTREAIRAAPTEQPAAPPSCRRRHHRSCRRRRQQACRQHGRAS